MKHLVGRVTPIISQTKYEVDNKRIVFQTLRYSLSSLTKLKCTYCSNPWTRYYFVDWAEPYKSNPNIRRAVLGSAVKESFIRVCNKKKCRTMAKLVLMEYL